MSNSEYKLTVGLEVHAELNTRSKMFCNSKNDPDEKRPNVNVCPVCMGHPGTLPVINKEAVRSVLRLGVAVGGTLADYTEFDRKNYFYPDIPKGYQISQYKYPLVTGGEILGIPLTRVHLEEDTARSIHKGRTLGTDSQGPTLEDSGGSLIDFNRAGVPLMELVTEPEIHSAEDAGNFARELQLILTYLGISHANMEKGEMRVEANISVSKSNTLGTKVEVKNLNSFKVVEKAIAYEMMRHIDLLESGGRVAQETRGWDDNRGKTFSQRVKEESHDYRYFPEPDLPKICISEVPDFTEAVLVESLPELPQERRERYATLGIPSDQAEIYVRDTERGKFFEEVARELKTPEMGKLASNYIVTDLKGKVEARAMADLVYMASEGEVSSRGVKDILKLMESGEGSPREIAERHNLIQQSDEGALTLLVEQVIKNNPDVVGEYKGGKVSSLQYLVGQAMKESKGSGNPQVLKQILEGLLG